MTAAGVALIVWGTVATLLLVLVILALAGIIRDRRARSLPVYDVYVTLVAGVSKFIAALETVGEATAKASDAFGDLAAALPPVITDIAVLDALPVGTVIRTPQGYVLELLTDGWYRAAVDVPYPKGNSHMLPAHVLYTPNEEPTT